MIVFPVALASFIETIENVALASVEGDSYNVKEAMIADGFYPPADPTALALEMWAAVHGVAALVISRPYLPWGDVEEFADRVLRSLCLGLVATTGITPTDSAADMVNWLKEAADERHSR